jgi:hypothetical protein
MARPLRIEFPGALYHVTAREDRQKAIFDDDQDRQVFLKLLGEVVSQFGCLRETDARSFGGDTE